MSISKHCRRVLTVGVAAVALVGLSACGSESTGETAAPQVAFTGDPVTVITVAPVNTSSLNYPGIDPIAKGAVAAINAEGGLAGHEVKLISCNDQVDPNKAADCARQAVDAGAIAMVGGMNTGGDTMLPILAKAGIPWIGGYALSAAELASSNSFPIVQGAAGMAGLGFHTVKNGCESVAFVLVEAATNQKAIDLIQLGVTKAGGGEVEVVKVPTTTTDFSTVAKQLEDVDCTIVGMLSDPTAALAKAADTLSVGTQFYLLSGSLDGTVIKQAGDSIEGAISMQPFVSSEDPVWDSAHEAVSDVDWEQPYYMNTWAAYQVLKSVAGGLQENLTAENLRTALTRATAEDAGGLMAPVDFSTPFAVSGMTQLFNHKAMFVEAKDGKVVATGDFEDFIAPVFGG